MKPWRIAGHDSHGLDATLEKAVQSKMDVAQWSQDHVMRTSEFVFHPNTDRRRDIPLSGHDSHEEQHQFENENRDDGQLEQVSARDGDLLDGKPVDIVQCGELFLDTGLPRLEPEPRGGQMEEFGGVDVADHL